MLTKADAHSDIDFYFSDIDKLDLSFSILEKIPECVFKMRYLKTLKLRHCHLNQLPDRFSKNVFPKLKHLILSSNNLEEIPASLQERRDTLSTLKLDGNLTEI